MVALLGSKAGALQGKFKYGTGEECKKLLFLACLAVGELVGGTTGE